MSNFKDVNYITYGNKPQYFYELSDQDKREVISSSDDGCSYDQVEEQFDNAEELFFNEEIEELEKYIEKNYLPLKIEYGYYEGFRLVISQEEINRIKDNFFYSMVVFDEIPTYKYIKDEFKNKKKYLNNYNDNLNISCNQILKIKKQSITIEQFKDLCNKYIDKCLEDWYYFCIDKVLKDFDLIEIN